MGDMLRRLRDASGADLIATTMATTGSPFYSESFPLDDLDIFGLILVAGNEQATTTLDVTVEYSPDNGTTWFSFPDGLNSATQAALAQISANGNYSEFWQNLLAGAPQNSVLKPVFRFKFVVAGAGGAFDVTAYLNGRYD